MLMRFLLGAAVVLAWASLWPVTVPVDAPVAQALGPLLAVLAPALVSAIAGITSTAMNNRATSRAADTASRSNDQALAFEREKEANRRAEWLKTEEENARRWQEEINREQRNLDRDFGEAVFRDRRKEPYREVGRAALSDLNDRRAASMRDLVGVGRI